MEFMHVRNLDEGSASVWRLIPGPRPRWAISAAVVLARAHAANEVAVWRRRSWQPVGFGVSSAAELLQLRPADHQVLWRRQDGGEGADGKTATSGTGV